VRVPDLVYMDRCAGRVLWEMQVCIGKRFALPKSSSSNVSSEHRKSQGTEEGVDSVSDD
jgi:hypothetical protein